ncbi:transmembrane protein 229A-like [Canis aureus]
MPGTPRSQPGPPQAGVLLARRRLLHSLTRFAPEKVCLPAALPQRLRLQFSGLPVGPRGAADPGGQALRLGLRGGPGAAVRGRCAGAAGLQDVLALSRGPVLPKRFLRLRHRGRPSSGPSLGRARPRRSGRRWPRRPPRHRGRRGAPLGGCRTRSAFSSSERTAFGMRSSSLSWGSCSFVVEKLYFHLHWSRGWSTWKRCPST